MYSLFRIIILFLYVLLKVNASTHHLQPANIIYVDGHTTDDIKDGPKSAKHQINSQNFVGINNNNQHYQNGQHQQGNNQNARYIVQSNGSPTIQTIYESSSVTPNVGYHQTSTESSSQQQNSANSHQSSSSTSSTYPQFVQPQAVIINQPSQGYLHTQVTDSPHGISQGAHTVNQYNPTVIETSSIQPGYQTTTTSSENAFESSSQSSSSSSSKSSSSSQFSNQGTTINPGYQPEIVQVTTPYSVQIDNNQHANIDGSAKYLPPFQTNYQISSTPATTLQTFESSSDSSSEHQSSSKSSSQSNQKTSISMSVTPTPYTISVSTPQTYELSHPQIPITPVPVHQPIPEQHVPIYKPIIQPAPFSIPVVQNHPTPAPVPQTVAIHPAVKPVPFTPTLPIVHHGPPGHPHVQTVPFIPSTPSVHHSPLPQPTIHHVPVVTEIPVHEVQEHHGVIEKTINVPEHGIKTQTYEIRRPAIQKQFYDIEERVVVRPAGSVVVEIDQPLSKTAKGGEVIVPVNGNSGQDHGISAQDHNNGVVYTHGVSHGQNGGTIITGNQDHSQNSGTVITENQGYGQNSGTVVTENQGYGQNSGTVVIGNQGHAQPSGTVLIGNQGHGIHGAHNGGGYSHGFVQSYGNEGNQGNHQFITTGGNNYQHVFGTFGYYPYPNICDQFSQKFQPVQSFSVHHPSIGYGDQQYQPSNHGITSTTPNPILSTTSAALKNDDDDSVVINTNHEHPSAKYVDSTTQDSQISSTTEGPFSQYSQQQPQAKNSTFHQMPHMITVGDPDFQSPPYIQIRPNGEGTNQVNTNNLQINQQHPAVRGDLHNTGAHTLYTMQSLMNDEFLNPKPQPTNQQQQQQQVNFNQNQQFPNQQIQNNTTQPHIVYAISVRNPNNYVAPQQRQLVFPQQNSAYTVQQHTPYDNSGYRQQIVQLPQQYNQHTPQHSTAYTIPHNQQSISHSPLAYSSSYFNQQIPNTPPINVNFSPYHHQSPIQHHNIQNTPNDASRQDQYKNPRLNTAPSVFPHQEYEQQTASYTQQPQNYVKTYHQQQQPVYTQNAAFTQPPQNYLGNNEQQFPIQQNNQGPVISGNQQPDVKNQVYFVPNNNTQLNHTGSPVQILFNSSDNYPVIDIRNNFNGTNNTQGHNINTSNNPIRGDIVKQSDSQPQSSSISGQYENSPSLNINYQPNENQKQLLNFILANQGSGNDHDNNNNNNNNNQDLNIKSHVISATPAPKYSEPAGERVHTRRIVVNQPLETVQVVQEQIPVTNYKQVKVQQPTVYKTSRVGLKRVENSIPIFIQPQHLQGYEQIPYNSNQHHQPVSYSYFHRQ